MPHRDLLHAPSRTRRHRRVGRAIGAVVATLTMVTGLGTLGAPSASAVTSTAACAPYELIGARGQTEPQGFGYVLGAIVNTVLARTTSQIKPAPLVFDANADALLGVNDGIRQLVATLNTRSAQCPRTRFILMGFSMGAYVIGETLSTAPRYPGVVSDKPSATALSRIAVVVIYGDGGFNAAGAPISTGTFAPGYSGLIVRPVSALSAWNDRMRNVCNYNDPICNSGSDNAAHQDYVKYADATAGYVQYVINTYG